MRGPYASRGTMNSTWPVVVRGASEGFTGANVPRVTRENCLSGEYTVGADLYSCGVCAGWRALLVWGPALLVTQLHPQSKGKFDTVGVCAAHHAGATGMCVLCVACNIPLVNLSFLPRRDTQILYIRSIYLSSISCAYIEPVAPATNPPRSPLSPTASTRRRPRNHPRSTAAPARRSSAG